MFPNLSKLRLTCTLLAASGLLSLSAQAHNNASDLFMSSFRMRSEAEKLEQGGDLQSAISRYQQAQSALSAIVRDHPEWQPEVVNYRLRLIEEAISRLQLRGAAPVIPSTPVVAPNPATPAPAMPAVPAATSGSPLDIINEQFRQLQTQVQDLQQKLRVYEDGYANVVKERDQATAEVGQLRNQLKETEALIGSMKADVAKGKATQEQLDELMTQASTVREQLSSREEQLNAMTAEVSRLENEKSQLTLQNTELNKELEEVKSIKNTPEELKTLMADNKRLKGELEAAQKQVEALKLENANKDKEIASLREQITGIQGELTKLRQENTQFQGQIAELTLQLKQVNENLAKTPDGEQAQALIAENSALRAIIMRELRLQQRQLQAKEIVIAEMKKMEGASQLLIENLEDMTSGKIRITVDEESLFTEPQLRDLLAFSGGVYATLQARADNAQPGDPRDTAAAQNLMSAPVQDEASLIEEANRALSNADYRSAEFSYQEALRANPKNIMALNNLAGIKLHQKQFDEAEVLLQKSLVYDPQNEFALYRLGICYFQQNKLAEAKVQFERNLAVNKKNARINHYLGIIATRQGNRDRAEAEFKSAIALEPTYGDAHFNLAVLYATSAPPDLQAAYKHYQDALANGIKPDPSMDNLLKSVAQPQIESSEESSTSS